MSYNAGNNDGSEFTCNDLRHDEATFEVFVKKHYRHLCVYCNFKFGFDMQLAEDIVNTSFIKLWEVRQTLSDDMSPKSYLYKIVHNTSLNFLKHEKVRQKHAQEVLRNSSEIIEQSNFDSVDLKRLRTDIQVSIAELPEQMRKIFELSKFEGLKYAEIAAHLNISKKTVQTQMSRALTRLREKLTRYDFVWFILLILAFL